MNFFIKKIFFLLALMLVFLVKTQGQENPVADPQAIVLSGNMRFTVLTPEMIRIEWSDSKNFEDRASFIVVNRRLPVPEYNTFTKDGYLYIETEKLELRYKLGTYPVTNPVSSENLKISINLPGFSTYWYPGKQDPLNLKGTLRTLDHSSGDNLRNGMEDGLLSRSGWVLLDEAKRNGDTSRSLLFEDQGGAFDWVAQPDPGNKIDWYFMAYGNDFKKALLDFTKIGGKQPMPPLYAFGYWYSKYEKYSAQDFMEIVNDIKHHDIPIDVMVVDMDWHRDGWTGWSWNRDLFPDPEGFIEWLHQNELKTTLNLHPADGIGTHEDHFIDLANDLGLPADQTIKWNIENQTFYEKFFKNILRPLEDIGVDFWWLDWQQWMLAPEMDDLGNTFWLNYVFYNDMKVNRPERRPMIFHRWGGLGNHRYPIGFSGDSWATFPTLAFQIYFNSTASNVAYGYWSHDLGGHNQAGPNNPELYLRWIQFGVFSPITRTHATNAEHIERRIWKYPNFELMRDALELRYALIPYIYTSARQAYDTGVSLCRPLYYDSPADNEAYKQETSYMFGDQILVSPIVTASENEIGTASKSIWLPEGEWVEAATGTILEGKQNYKRIFAQDEIPFFYKSGAVIPMFSGIKHLKDRPDTLVVRFVPGEGGEFSLYEDEGDNNNYQHGAYTKTKIEQITDEQQGQYIIHPRNGAFSNMPDERSYELRLMSKLPPDKVIVDGINYEYSSVPREGFWSYDGKELAIVINILPKKCDLKTVVDVDFNDNQAEADELFAGKAGQMKRLLQCRDSLTVRIDETLPEEFSELCQTAEKIALEPDLTLTLLQEFDENIEKSFELLLGLKNAPTEEIKEWRDFILLGNSPESESYYGDSETDEKDGVNTDGTKLWIVGSAIPGNVAVLTEDPSQTPGYFRYHGELLSGEFKIMNTPSVQSNTVFYVPSSEHVEAVGISPMKATFDSELTGWRVDIPDDSYKLKINAIGKTFEGELFRAREDLYIVGGATENGWDAGRAIRLKRDEENPNLYVFSGELKEAATGDDRNQFKFLGQNDWGPVSFHPKTPQESIFGSRYIYENYPGDHKWSIESDKSGVYVIKVDLLKETIYARYTDSFLYGVYINGVEWTNLDEVYALDCEMMDQPLEIKIVPIQGKTVDVGNVIHFTATDPGMNIFEFTISSENGVDKKSYQLKINRPFDFSDLVIQNEDNSLTVNNNPVLNGGYKFKEFAWYVDGGLVSQNMTYSPPAGNADNDSDSGEIYVVKMVDDSGNMYQTCPVELKLESLSCFMVYPNFAEAGETVNVEGILKEGQLSAKSKLKVFDINGRMVHDQPVDGDKTSFEMNFPGFYVVQLISSSCIRTARLLIH
ncbi:TIM-barrel domain-containing protein [Thermophagus sp. OGC60D27]|uniref:TIM-barrel domain-containing protein n=1 Tax=Thermophagus sp. OGC60D27 TaxID=3458415 RepID=UPI004037C409